MTLRMHCTHSTVTPSPKKSVFVDIHHRWTHDAEQVDTRGTRDEAVPATGKEIAAI